MATVTRSAPQVRIGDLPRDRAGFRPRVAATPKDVGHHAVEARCAVIGPTLGDRMAWRRRRYIGRLQAGRGPAPENVREDSSKLVDVDLPPLADREWEDIDRAIVELADPGRAPHSGRDAPQEDDDSIGLQLAKHPGERRHPSVHGAGPLGCGGSIHRAIREIDQPATEILEPGKERLSLRRISDRQANAKRFASGTVQVRVGSIEMRGARRRRLPDE